MPHFMHVALPLQPVCQGVPGDVRQACSEDVITCRAVRVGGTPDAGETQSVPCFQTRCLPPRHYQFCTADAGARPEGSFAVSVSLAVAGTLRHFSASFDTRPGQEGRVPLGAGRGVLVLLCHLIGLLCLAHAPSPVTARGGCHSVAEFSTRALADDSLLHDCVLALFLSILDRAHFWRSFEAGIHQTGRMPRAAVEDLGTAETMQTTASVWTVLNVVLRLWARRRATDLTTLVSTLINVRDHGATVRGLCALGLAVAASTQRDKDSIEEAVAAQLCGWNEEYRPIPHHAIIIGSCDNMGMRELAGFVQFILLTYMVVTVEEQVRIGMHEQGATEKKKGQPTATDFEVSQGCWAFLGRRWRQYVGAAIDVAEAVRSAEDEVHAYFMDTEIPAADAMQIALADVQLHQQRGGTALHTAEAARELGASAAGIAPAQRSLGATAYETNRVQTLPLSHADLSQKHMVDRIMKYFVCWKDAVLAKEDDGKSLMHSLGVWFTCDGQPARQMLGMRRDDFYNFPVCAAAAP